MNAQIIILKTLCYAMLFLLLLWVQQTSAQQAARPKELKPLIDYQSVPALLANQQAYADKLINSSYAQSFSYCNIDVSLLNSENILLNLFDGFEFTVSHRKTDTRGPNSFSWFGKHTHPDGSAVFTVNRGMVTGWIQIGGNQYSIYPVGNGMHIIFRVKQSGGNDESPESYRKMLSRATEKEAESNIDQETGLLKDGFTTADCKMRVAVCYTDNVAAALADPFGFVQDCIDVTNECYNNSNINFEVELAIAYEDNYAETSDADADLDNFHDTSDGILDEILDKRQQYDADLAVLIIENMDDYCGLAWTVDITGFNRSYCVVKRSCAVSNYSFPHEMGHLYGAHHDPYVDDGLSPYSNGHGFVKQSKSWRTVMAYNDQCEDDGDDCPRIPNFSNPDVTYNGDATGTYWQSGVATSNNEAVHEDSRSAVADNEVTVHDKSFPSQTLEDGEGGDVIALETVTNSSTYHINSGAEMTWRAGTSITLSPGFVASDGSFFHAYLDECTALKQEEENTVTTSLGGAITAVVYPNPFNGSTTADVKLATDGEVEIRLFDILGREVKVIQPTQFFNAGSHLIKIDGTGLPKGVYFLKVQMNDSEVSYKVAKTE